MQLACITDDPVSVSRPPVINAFTPPEQFMDVFVGDTLFFNVTAMDPDRTPLKLWYTCNDSVVSSGARWKYVSTDTGRVVVACVVSDGQYSSRIQWEMKQSIPINNPPKITSFSPVERFPVMIVGDELEFVIQASDPDNDPLVFYFNLNDSLVSHGTKYLHVAQTQGEKRVVAVATDGEDFATREWILTVSGVPDTLPPAEVPVISVETGEDPGEVKVTWLAVGEDGVEGIASNYLVRTSPSPITDEISWARSSQRPNVPDPAAPGEVMDMVVTGMIPARYTYVAVRAEDNFGNLSPIGAALGAYARGMRISGIIRDALTADPIPNVIIKLAHFTTTSDVYGQFDFIELPPLNTTLDCSDDGQVGFVGEYYDLRIPYVVVHEDYLPVFMLPDRQLGTSYYPNFLVFYRFMTDVAGLQFPHHQRRWELPIDIYSLPFQKDGLDYQATIHQVAIDLNAQLDLNAFNVIDAEPEIGIKCIFRSDIVYDNFGVDLWSADYYPLQGACEFRKVYTPSGLIQFQTIIRHELGHGLGLNHSADPAHLMVGGMAAQVNTFTPDEVAVIRAHYHIPRGLDMTCYITE